MLIQILFLIAFFYLSIPTSSGIVIGRAVSQIYVPFPSNINPPISFNYSTTCDECLCYALSSTTVSFVAINCLINIRLCWFYTSYTASYSFQWNSTSYLYLFQLPPPPTTTISTSTATVSTTSSSTTTKTSTTTATSSSTTTKTSTTTATSSSTTTKTSTTTATSSSTTTKTSTITTTSSSTTTTTSSSTTTKTSTTTTTSSSTTTATSSSTTTKTSTTTTSTTSTISTTTAKPFVVITNPNDTMVAIYNTTAGGQSLNSTPGSGVGQYPSAQGPTVCIDFASTTCLNFGNTGANGTVQTSTAGVGTGIYTIPVIGVSIVRSIQFQTGGDYPARDPLTITLEGSNNTGAALSLGTSWTLLYSNTTGLVPLNVTRLAWGVMQNFTNTIPFTAYRMIVTSQRGIDYCIQFAEMHLYGFV